MDRTTSGSPLKCLSIVGDYMRECLHLEVDRRIATDDTLDMLAEWFAMRGVPKHIRGDNGLEFVAQVTQSWLENLGIDALYIEPGSPWENGYAESFHSRFRDEFLALEMLDNLATARRLTAV